MGQITEKKLKEALKWYLAMNTWEETDEALEKTEKAKKILNGYVDGKIKLKKNRAVKRPFKAEWG